LPHPDEHFVVDNAGVDDGTVTDGDQLAKPRLVRRIDVNDGIVLNVGARADNYPIDIATQNSAVPYTRFFHQRYVADDGCARDDAGGGMNARAKFQPGVDAGMTARDWVWRNGNLHGRNGSLGPGGTGVFAQDDEFVPCSHFFIIEAN